MDTSGSGRKPGDGNDEEKRMIAAKYEKDVDVDLGVDSEGDDNVDSDYDDSEDTTLESDHKLDSEDLTKDDKVLMDGDTKPAATRKTPPFAAYPSYDSAVEDDSDLEDDDEEDKKPAAKPTLDDENESDDDGDDGTGGPKKRNVCYKSKVKKGYRSSPTDVLATEPTDEEEDSGPTPGVPTEAGRATELSDEEEDSGPTPGVSPVAGLPSTTGHDEWTTEFEEQPAQKLEGIDVWVKNRKKAKITSDKYKKDEDYCEWKCKGLGAPDVETKSGHFLKAHLYRTKKMSKKDTRCHVPDHNGNPSTDTPIVRGNEEVIVYDNAYWQEFSRRVRLADREARAYAWNQVRERRRKGVRRNKGKKDDKDDKGDKPGDKPGDKSDDKSGDKPGEV